MGIVPQAASMWGKGELDFQCIFRGGSSGVPEQRNKITFILSIKNGCSFNENASLSFYYTATVSLIYHIAAK